MKWPLVELAALTRNVKNGLSVRQSAELGGIPVTRIETISREAIDPQKVGYAGIQPGQFDDWSLEEGDILFSHINSEAHIGKCAIYEGYPKPLIHGMNLLCIRADHSIVLPKFLLYTLRSPSVKSQLPAITKRAINQASISSGNLRTTKLPLPTLSEQQRIVEILDQADALRRKRAEADAKAARILPALFYKMFGDPATNPMGWPLAKVAGVALVQGGLTLSQKRDSYPLRRPYLRVANVQRGFLFLDEVKVIGLDEDEFQKTKLEAGDLLLVEGNGNPEEIGRAAIWNGAVPDCVHQNHLIRVRCDASALTPEFVLAFINGPTGKGYFLSAGNTTSGLVTISTRMVKECPIPLPPLPLQQEFSALAVEVTGIKAKQARLRQHLDDLFQSLLHRAFSGDLTAQWREANMAELLGEMEHQERALGAMPGKGAVAVAVGVRGWPCRGSKAGTQN